MEESAHVEMLEVMRKNYQAHWGGKLEEGTREAGVCCTRSQVKKERSQKEFISSDKCC